MKRHRLLPLCALLGVLFAGLLPNLEAQEAQDSADLVLLIDGSENVGAANFTFVRDLVLRIIEPLDVGRDTVRVALALYNGNPQIKFYLNSFDSKSSVLEAVKGLSYSGGDESNLGFALEEVAKSLLSQTAGGRVDEGVPQMLVVISAGPSTDDTSAGDRALKRAGVITLGVTIGETASTDLEAVATDKSFVLSAPDFRTVASMGDRLLPLINGVVQRNIIVQTEFTQVLAVGPRDIIFLIDSTMGATLINSVREFIKRFVNIIPIGPDGVQVGVAQFSNIPRLEMDLNSYGSREELTAALGSIKPRPGQTVNIGAALDFVRTNMLRPEKGSRIQQGVPQLLLLMTSKKSSDSVEAPAKALQQMGVLTLAAGSKTATENELQQIAFADTVAFYLKDFRSLLRNPKAIVDALSTLAGVVVTEGPTESVVEITTVQTQKVVRDIVFLVDGSNYVGSSNFSYVRDFIINVVNQLDVRPDRVRIGLLQFAESQKIEFHLNTYSSRQDVVNQISQLRLTGGSVLNTGAAMNYALSKMFQPSTGSRRKQGVQQVLVLITGGPVQDQAKNAADKLALAGVLTFTVSSGQADEALMKTVAFVEDLAYHETSFSNLPALAEQIMPKLITVVGDTDVTETTFPEEPVLAVGPRDIIFLIDSTMGATLINSVREFIKRFVNIIPIGPDGVQVGVAQFSNIPRLEMDLNSYGSREELTAALGSIKPRPGQTVNIGAALDFVRTNMLRPEKGSRIQQGVPQLLLLMTSKKSSDSVEAPAKALQQMGVLTLAAGSKTATENELQQIAFADTVAFYLKDFRSLLRNPKAIVDALSTLAGVVVTEGPTESVVEITTVQTQKVVRDIVFLVDGSNYVGSSNFSYVRDFIINVVNQLDVRPDRVRIGLLQFAESQKIEFHLNTYSSRQDVVNQISQLRLTGGLVLNTGAAMNYALSKMFQPSTGSRRKQGVQQVLVLITGGPVQDQAKNAADKLALAGVLTFTVSSGQADEALMKTVAFVEDLAYHETSFSNLPALAEQIMPKLITVVGDTDVTETTFPEEPVLAVGPRDIIFLIDSTMGATLINSVREFIKRFVNIIPIGPDGVQVGVAQFSNIPRLEMDLNSYGSREELTAALGSIKPRPGQTVNIGAALDFVRTNMLRPEKGSRIQQGVPQLLLLMTSKKSSDSVEAPAKALQQMGVLTLAAGSKTATENELQQIAFADTVAFYLKDFRSLLRNPKAIVDALSTLAGVVVTEGPTEPEVEITTVQTQKVVRDIVFLVDGSNYVGSSNFPYVRDFIINVVNQLDVRPDRVRIGLLQFAESQKIEFHLNTYSSRQDVVNKISQLRLTGGSVLNTGAAMNYALSKMFQPSTGSRRKRGVQQVLVLITGGPVQDQVKNAADKLALAGVLTFTVSSGQADEALMKTVAFVEDLAYHETSFSNLPALAEQIMPKLRTVVGDTDMTGFFTEQPQTQYNHHSQNVTSFQ